MTFAVNGTVPVLRTSRGLGLDLLEWLGLGRPAFGAVDVRELLPLCRRRLWPIPRNDGPLRGIVASLARTLEKHGEGVVHFG
jgi:hypothetical protein